MTWQFPPFRLDMTASTLWRDDTRVRLHSRPLAVLEHLVRHSGELVTKETLLRSVWFDAHVTIENVKVAVNHIRRALGDDVHQPRYIETNGTNGYRFIGPVTYLPDSNPSPDEPLLVGRHGALVTLRKQLSAANTGTRRVVFVTGEEGIGKTALCERFLSEIDTRDGTLVARVQCANGGSAAELLSPVCQGLADEWRSSSAHYAAAPLADTADAPQGAAGAGDADRDPRAGRLEPGAGLRVARELNALVDTLALERTIVLLVEDLHRADSTLLETLSAIGGRAQAGRLLILTTIRLNDAPASAYALANTRVRLKLRSRAIDVRLGPLTEHELVELLTRRLGDEALAATMASALHQGAAGNPLRVQSLLKRLEARGLLERTASGWRLHHSDLALAEIVEEATGSGDARVHRTAS